MRLQRRAAPNTGPSAAVVRTLLLGVLLYCAGYWTGSLRAGRRAAPSAAAAGGGGAQRPVRLREMAAAPLTAVPTTTKTLADAVAEEAAARAAARAERKAAIEAGHAAEAERGAPPWEQELVQRTVCSDTCASARNGVCDDGRPSKGHTATPLVDTGLAVLCDLGSDCEDCGAWEFKGTAAAAEWTPIRDIAQTKNFEVRARTTQLPSPFVMAYTNPEQDVDVSGQMHATAQIEPGITWVWHKLLKERCVGAGGERALVVDVGANMGYYTLLAASLGCRVMAWEPVPYFAAYLKHGLLANNLTHLVDLRENIVGREQGKELVMQVPNRGIWGTAGVGGWNIDRAIDNDGAYDTVVKKADRLDVVVQEEVLLMKIDVEGFEPEVLRGASKLLLNGAVQHVMMEYSPGVAERHLDFDLYDQNPIVLAGLLKAGYRIVQMDDRLARGVKEEGWEGTMPPLEEVTMEALRHDMADASRLRDHRLGCPLPGELVGVAPGMWGCGSLPEGFDPQSFRSSFGHNTNVWAFRGANISAVEGLATLIPLEQDLSKTFFSEDGLGAARRICSDLRPESQVMHRCHCTKPAVCGELEKLVTQLAAEGKMPPFGADAVMQEGLLGLESTWRR